MFFTRGVRYMMWAVFFFASMNACVKFVPDIPAVEIVFFRSLVSFVLSYTILKIRKNYLWGNNPKLLVLRGVAGAIALIFYFKTLQGIPLASAVTIQFLAPIFTTLIGVIMVKEHVKPMQWLFFLIAFVGTLIIHGFDARISFFYLSLGIGAAFASALAHNLIRKMNTTEDPLVIVFYFPLVTLPVTGLISIFNWKTPTFQELGILILIGVLTQIAQVLMTKAIQAEELSKVESLRYLNIVYALLFGYFLFGETYNFFVYAGMSLTLSGVILNIAYKTWMVGRHIKKIGRDPHP
jgi:drug/metabolite transporter (DMT)-like permease